MSFETYRFIHSRWNSFLKQRRRKKFYKVYSKLETHYIEHSRDLNDINIQDPYNGKSLLHIAVENNRQDIIDALLKRDDIKINTRDFLGNTALMYVKNINVLDLLVASGASIDIENAEKQTIFHKAFDEKLVKLQNRLFEIILAQHELVFHLLDEIMSKIVSVMCLEISSTSAVNLLKRFLDMEEVSSYYDSEKNNPLHYAFKLRKFQIAEFLLENKVSLDMKNVYGQTPLMVIGPSGQREIVRYFIAVKDKHYQNSSAVKFAIKTGSTNFLLLVIQNYAKLDKNGYDLLYLFKNIQYYSTETALLLINAGCSLKCFDTETYRTPLHWAAKLYDVEVVMAILKKCNRVNFRRKDICNCTLLDYAIQYRKMLSVFLYYDKIPTSKKLLKINYKYLFHLQRLEDIMFLMDYYNLKFKPRCVNSYYKFLNYQIKCAYENPSNEKLLKDSLILYFEGANACLHPNTFPQYDDILENCIDGSKSTLEFFYKKFFHVVANDFRLSSLVHAYFAKFPTNGSISLAIKLFKYQTDFLTRYKCLMLYLSVGMKFTEQAAVLLFKFFGPGKEVNAVTCSLHSENNLNSDESTIGYLLNFKRKPDFFNDNVLFEISRLTEITILKIISTFIVNAPELTKHVTTRLGCDHFVVKILSSLNNRVPSLSELSRDAVRNALGRNSNSVTVTRRKVNELPINYVLKEIILLNRPIYFF